MEDHIIPKVPDVGSEWWVARGWSPPTFERMRVYKTDDTHLFFQVGNDIGTNRHTNTYPLTLWRHSVWAGLVHPYDALKRPGLPPKAGERIWIIMCGHGAFFMTERGAE